MIRIGARPVSHGHPCFVIAELGINHNGSIEMALELIQAAKQAGAEAVKFQKRTPNVVFSKTELSQPREFDQVFLENALDRRVLEGVEYDVFPSEILEQIQSGAPKTNGMLKYALEFGEKEYDMINRLCLELGLVWSASPWDGLSVSFINGFTDVAFMKVASACLTNRDLLERVRATKKPVILSTGGSSLEQIKAAIAVLGTDELILLHCVAEYPIPDEDTNLAMIGTLRHLYPDLPVGFSSHSTDIFPPVMAVGMGACVVEAHLTLDQSLPGSDQKASLTPEQFAKMVEEIRRFERLRGDGVKRVCPGEVAVMKKLRRVDDLL